MIYRPLFAAFMGKGLGGGDGGLHGGGGGFSLKIYADADADDIR